MSVRHPLAFFSCHEVEGTNVESPGIPRMNGFFTLLQFTRSSYQALSHGNDRPVCADEVFLRPVGNRTSLVCLYRHVMGRE